MCMHVLACMYARIRTHACASTYVCARACVYVAHAIARVYVCVCA